jgi:hypothetical protein
MQFTDWLRDNYKLTIEDFYEKSDIEQIEIEYHYQTYKEGIEDETY